MKHIIWIKFISITLVIAMITVCLSAGAALAIFGSSSDSGNNNGNGNSASDDGALPNPLENIFGNPCGDGKEFVPGEVLASADSLEHAQMIAGFYDLSLKSYAYGIAVFAAHDPEQVVDQSRVARRDSFALLGYNWLYKTCEADEAMPGDYDRIDTDNYLALATPPLYPNQWHRYEMDADRALALSTGKGVVIAVIDTGIDIEHPSFSGRISSKSYNAYFDIIGLEHVKDDYGHGTHVSGIALASRDANAGVSGIAPDAELLAIKANLPSTSVFWSVDLYRAINYAVENGSDIINMSLGRLYFDSDSADPLEQAIIADAVKSGVTVICAAGNDRDSHAGYPAAYPECIAVSATKQGYSFDLNNSNYGPEINIAAPGVDIYSSVFGGGYGYYSGTSMASANTTGVAALIKSLCPEYTPEQVRDALCETARDAGPIGYDDHYGYGIVNAYAALLGSDALYNVTFDFNHSGRAPVTVKAVSGDNLLDFDLPIRDGYSFMGWYFSGTDVKFDFADPIVANLKLDAKWSENAGGVGDNIDDPPPPSDEDPTPTPEIPSPPPPGEDPPPPINNDHSPPSGTTPTPSDTVNDSPQSQLGQDQDSDQAVITGIVNDFEQVPPFVGAWDNPYLDVPETAWFYYAVQFVTESVLMDGTGNSMFSPSVTMSRSMLVTILYRLERSPEISGELAFSDVKSGQWYSDAILWAAEKGIVDGYGNGEFGLNDPVTREQAVTILYRYAKAKGFDVSASADLSGFADVDSISGWALEGMKWAVAEGIIQGQTSTTIAPKGNSTRAEAATIFKRFVEKYMREDANPEQE